MLATADDIAINVSERVLLSIPDYSLRQQHLRYRYFQTVARFIESGDYTAQTAAILISLYHSLVDKIAEDGSEKMLSEHSRGLFDLFLRGDNLPQVSNLPTPVSAKGLEQSVFVVDGKKGGIEPGYEAVLLEDVFSELDRYFSGDDTKIITFLHEVGGQVNRIVEEIPGTRKYLIKFDYSMRPGSPLVFLSVADVKRTATIKKLCETSNFIGNIAAQAFARAKSDSPDNINLAALREVISNDIARLFMPVQEQTLALTRYENGALKLMTKSAWLEGHCELGQLDDVPLLGGGKHPQAYRARKLWLPAAGIVALTDDRISNLHALQVPFALQGDYDKIGSKGQNLLLRPSRRDPRTGVQYYEIVGIDFGHGFADDNGFLDSLSLAATVPESFTAKFKNYTLLSDVAFSSTVAGARNVVAHKAAIMQIVSDYLTVLQSYRNSIECQQDATTIKLLTKAASHIAQQVTDRIGKIHSRYGDYLSLTDAQLELTANLRTWVAAKLGKTTLRSADNCVGLQHLRIVDNKFSGYWALVQLMDGRYQLTMDKQGFNSKTLKELKQGIEAWDCGLPIGVNLQSSMLSVTFPAEQLEQVCQRFSEEQICNVYHQADFSLIRNARYELKLRDLVTAPWFVEQGLSLVLQVNQLERHYCIIIAGLTDDLLAQLHHVFPAIQLDAEHQATIQFTPEQAVTVYDNLISFQAQVEQYHLLQEEAEQVRAQQERERQQRAQEEQARAEQARLQRAQEEEARAEQARLQRAQEEQARAEQARLQREREKQARAEQARLQREREEQARAEQARLQREREEQARAEQARLQRAQEEQARAEQARLQRAQEEQARAEQARLQREREEAARRLEQARQQAANNDVVVETSTSVADVIEKQSLAECREQLDRYIRLLDVQQIKTSARLWPALQATTINWVSYCTGAYAGTVSQVLVSAQEVRTLLAGTASLTAADKPPLKALITQMTLRRKNLRTNQDESSEINLMTAIITGLERVIDELNRVEEAPKTPPSPRA